jgi:hypothetical protein
MNPCHSLPAAGFPQLAFACPIRWDELSGDEREKSCARCGHRVTNLSALAQAEREALLARVGQERVCVSFYRRLSGEYVTPESPLTPDERSRIRQLGVAALSAGALALAAGCVASPAKTPPVVPGESSQAAPATGEDTIILQAFGVVAEPSPPKHSQAPDPPGR